MALKVEQDKLEKLGKIIGLPFKYVDVNQLLANNKNRISKNGEFETNFDFLLTMGHDIYKQAIVTYLYDNVLSPNELFQKYDINKLYEYNNLNINDIVRDSINHSNNNHLTHIRYLVSNHLFTEFYKNEESNMYEKIGNTYPLNDYRDYYTIARHDAMLNNPNFPDGVDYELINTDKERFLKIFTNVFIKPIVRTQEIEYHISYEDTVHNNYYVIDFIDDSVNQNDPVMIDFLNQIGIHVNKNNDSYADFSLNNEEMHKQIAAVYFLENYVVYGGINACQNLNDYLQKRIDRIRQESKEMADNSDNPESIEEIVKNKMLNNTSFSLYMEWTYNNYVLGKYKENEFLSLEHFLINSSKVLDRAQHKTAYLVQHYQPFEEPELKLDENQIENKSKKMKI